MNISGGGLKKYCETRWTSSYETISSVVRLQIPLEKVNYIFNLIRFFKLIIKILFIIR